MPIEKLTDATIYYQLEGPEQAPVLVLSNSLGAALEMWNPQMSGFCKRFRVLRYDTRGHGRSSTPAGEYTIRQLGQDVIDLLDVLGIEKASFCGISMGGMTGLWLGVHEAGRLERLVLCNTYAKLGDVHSWNERMEQVRGGGMNAIVDQVVERWFTDTFRKKDPAECTAVRAMLNTTSFDGYANCCAAIRDADLRHDLVKIKTKTLVVGGDEDLVTPPNLIESLAASIQNAEMHIFKAAHLSNIEAAQQFTDEVLAFLLDSEVPID